MGVETPTPASGVFHATFSVALHRTGSFWPPATPVAPGPRQWGQSAAGIATPTPANQNNTPARCLC
jgi:hypothetical protein